MLIKGSCNIKFMYKKCLSFIHWLGFSISCVMLVLAYFDQSQDEIVIHLIASSAYLASSISVAVERCSNSGCLLTPLF